MGDGRSGKQTKKQMKIWGLLLILAVFCGGTAGSFVRIIEANSLLVLAWRQFFSFLLLLPPALIQSPTLHPQLLPAGLIHSLAITSFYVSCHLTKLSHTYLFANLSPVVVILYNWFKGQPASRRTVTHLGVILVSSGLIISGLGSGEVSLLGDLVGLVSAVGFAGICLFNRQRASAPEWTAIATINGVSFLVILALSVLLEGTSLLSFDLQTGFLGVFTKQQFTINLLNAVLTGIGCASLISLCSRHLAPIIVTTGLLFEPITAAVVGWFLNVERESSLLTWALMAVVINSLFVLLNENQESEEAFRQSRGAKSDSSGAKSEKQLALLSELK